MNRLHFDSMGGASGDMILGALLDLGAPLEEMRRQLKRLPIGDFELLPEPCREGAIDGTRLTVRSGHAGHAPHRGLAEIRGLICASVLSERVKRESIKVFELLAGAEAKVHGTTADQVHFHEVGATDAIVDIAGACLALELLAIDSVTAGPLPLGHGCVKCAHGILPAPAPATVELLKGMDVFPVDEDFETVTPTGAALLTAWSAAGGKPRAGRLLRAGHGFGHHRLKNRPNLLRVFLLDCESGACGDECLVLECNLDDTVPELLGNLTNRLLAAGALDACLIPAQMKKQRPGAILSVICRSEQREALLDLIFLESTTFGVREYQARRTVLARRVEEISTPFGKLRVKVGEWRGRAVTRSPEYEDCVSLANRTGASVRAVYEAAVAAANGAQPA